MAQRNSTRQFQQWSAHGQLRGLATSGQPGALHAGLGHGTASPLATSAVSGWLLRRAAPRFGITTCIPSSAHRDGAHRDGHRLGANAGVRRRPGLHRVGGSRHKPSPGDRAQRRARRVFGRPLRAATPTRVLLASHRCVAGAAQAWEVSIAHGSALFPESGSPVGASAGSIGGRLFRRWGETARQVAARLIAGRCAARSRFAEAVKWPRTGHSTPSRPGSGRRARCRSNNASMRQGSEQRTWSSITKAATATCAGC
jgi:hypothetical protein